MNNRFNLRGLRTCLKEFSEEGGRYAINEKWRIAKGGYDLQWELYYDGIACMRCVSGTIEVTNAQGKDNIDDVKSIVERYI